jgi:signal transduction histidine kinase
MGVVGTGSSSSSSGVGTVEKNIRHDLELVEIKHDLLTPTNTVIAHIERLLKYADQEVTYHDFIPDLNKMLVAGEQLLTLITQLFSKKDSSQGEIDRETFTSTIRHNLRTPINAIIGYGEMLLEDVDKETHHQAQAELQKILTSARRLLTLIGDLSYYSKSESLPKKKTRWNQNQPLLRLL